MNKLIATKRAYLKAENAKYPKRMQPVPKPWPPSQGVEMLAVWRSCDYFAQIVKEKSGAIRLSVNRSMVAPNGDWEDGIPWDDLQRIKGEVGYVDSWMVEMYPPTNDVVNVANIRHLFLMPCVASIGWSDENKNR